MRKGARHIAIYHCSIKITSRGKGRSAVAAAAYRAGEKITNEYDGKIHDFTRKGGVVHSEILLPDNAPAEYKDRAVLWNAVEKIEKAKNAQLAREIEIALPAELSLLENKSLVRDYVKRNFVSAGMCADICIHDKKDGNPHAHILLTMRPFTERGEWGTKQKKEYILDGRGNKIYDPKKRQYKCKSVPSTDWNEQTKAEEWRAAWAETANRYLEKLNHTERIDNRSYERQGIEQVPTIHLGAAASQMEKRGIRTERGDINREIQVTNQKLRELKARLVKLQNWVKEEAANTEPPTLADVIQSILSRRGQDGQSSRYQTIGNLRNTSKVLNFLTANKIFDMAGLNEKVNAMVGKQYDMRDKLKKVERRMATLDEHIQHSGNFKAYRGVKAQYQKLYSEYTAIQKAGGLFSERKAQKALDAANEYYEANRPQIAMYDNAEKYLRDVLRERFDIKKLPPVTAWQAERDKLTAERSILNREYIVLRNEVTEVDQIRRDVDDFFRSENRREQPHRSQGMEL